MTTAGSILADLRSSDTGNIGVAVIIGSSDIYSLLLAAWPRVVRALERDAASPFEEVPESIPKADHVRWLWSRVEPEPEPLWAEAAGLPLAPHVARAMRVLQDNGVVFPDGSTSEWAQQYMLSAARSQGVQRPER